MDKNDITAIVMFGTGLLLFMVFMFVMFTFNSGPQDQTERDMNQTAEYCKQFLLLTGNK